MNTVTSSIDRSILIRKYEPLSHLNRLERLFDDFDPSRILMTSSFGTSSALLLHMISKVAPGHPIHFIDTGYHFDENLAYRDKLIEQLNLNVVEVRSRSNKHRFTRENKTWKTNSDLCCFVNKVEPTNKLKEGHDIWISGLLRFQNVNRSGLNLFEPGKDITKFYPIIDMTAEDVQLYYLLYELPQNPLVYQGYGSVGCTHCTKKGDGREGRWHNSQKTECGLHV